MSPKCSIASFVLALLPCGIQATTMAPTAQQAAGDDLNTSTVAPYPATYQPFCNWILQGLQGAGWEVGAQAAREGIEALKERADEPPAEQSEKEKASAARKREQEAEREREERKRAAARRDKEIEARLKELKKRSGR